MINPYLNSDSNKRYFTYDFYLRREFGRKIARIPIDAGFTCPNRDGTKGTGGCAFCSGRGSGDFCAPPSVPLEEQFAYEKAIMEKKWKNTGYIVYFQAFTNTYANVNLLRELYTKAISLPGVVGISIATRPDCVSPETAELLRELSGRTHLTVELGLQTIHDATAAKMNICHTYDDFLRGYELLYGVRRGVHIINGLPGEDMGMMLETARAVASLQPDMLKIHLLHVISGTPLAKLYESGAFDVLTREEYVKTVVSQLELMPRDTVIGRVTGDGAPDTLVAPLWSKKKLCCMNEIDKEFARRGTYQGIYCRND